MEEIHTTLRIEVSHCPMKHHLVGQDLENWIEDIIQHTHRCINEHGELDPMLVFVAPNESNPEVSDQCLVPLEPFMVDDIPEELGKKMMARVLPQLLESHQAYASIVFLDAWATDGEVTDEVVTAPFPDELGAYEILVAVIDTRTSNAIKTWKMERDSEGNAKIGREVPWTSNLGDFTTFLHGGPPKEGTLLC